MGNNKWRTRLQTTCTLGQCMQALVVRKEMQCQKASGAIKWPLWGPSKGCYSGAAALS
jgi:hypothetical protein